MPQAGTQPPSPPYNYEETSPELPRRNARLIKSVSK
jgi:hypothetical protein